MSIAPTRAFFVNGSWYLSMIPRQVDLQPEIRLDGSQMAFMEILMYIIKTPTKWLSDQYLTT